MCLCSNKLSSFCICDSKGKLSGICFLTQYSLSLEEVLGVMTGMLSGRVGGENAIVPEEDGHRAGMLISDGQ